MEAAKQASGAGVNPAEIIGRKSFFVGLDTNVLPDSYLETFLAHGYECYRISQDHICSLQQKIEMVAALFKGALFFIYIDSPIEQITWEQCVQHLIETHPDACVSILYSKRGLDSDRQLIESCYTKIGVKAGCFALSYQRSDNFTILERLLMQNHANGRRKTIRAFCTGSCEATFTTQTGRERASILDISLSHFSCVFKGQELHFSKNQFFSGVQLFVNGNRFYSNVVFLMQRPTEKGMLMVFMFVKQDKTPGLNDDEFFKLCPKIYRMVTDPVKEQLLNSYLQINKLKNKNYTIENTIDTVLQVMASQNTEKKV